MRSAKFRSLLTTLLLVLGLSSASTAYATDFTVSSSSECTSGRRDPCRQPGPGGRKLCAGDGDDIIYLTDNISLDANLPTVRSTITVTTDNYRFRRVINGNRAHPIFNVEDGGRLTLSQLDLIDVP